MVDETNSERLRREALEKRLAVAEVVDRVPSKMTPKRREDVKRNMVAYRKRLAEKRKAEADELARLRAELMGEK